MNSNEPFEHDKPLRKILSEWHVNAALPPRFQEHVWKRIESAQGRVPVSRAITSALSAWLSATLTRPAVATAYVVVLLLVGVTIGHQQGESKVEHIKSDLKARYIQMVDPYKTPR